jgi:hypothetical protein
MPDDNRNQQSQKQQPKPEVIVIKNDKDFEKAIEKIYGKDKK